MSSGIVRISKSRIHELEWGRQGLRIEFCLGKHLGKWPLQTLRRKWEDNIKMDFREVVGGHG
jgi:hypothetical protein